MSKTPPATKPKRAAPRSAHQQRMLSGRRLDLLRSAVGAPCRDGRHRAWASPASRAGTDRPGAHIYSVAQHSLLVEALARARMPLLDRNARLAVLLHDAPEYVIGDMISPFKAVIGDSYKAVEHRLLAAIHLRFGLPAKLPDALQNMIKTADRAAAYPGGHPACRLRTGRARRFFDPPPKILT